MSDTDRWTRDSGDKLVLPDEGRYAVYWYVEDEAGNEQDKTAPKSRIIRYDNTSISYEDPGVTFSKVNTGPAARMGNFITGGNYFNEAVRITVYTADSESHPAQVYYSLDMGNTWKAMKTDSQISDESRTFYFDLPTDTDGMVQVWYYAVDRAGNREDIRKLKGENGSLEWIAESRGPVISSYFYREPVNESGWFNQTVHVNVEITDKQSGVAAGTASCPVKQGPEETILAGSSWVDHDPVEKKVELSPVIDFDCTELALKVKASDNSGNESERTEFISRDTVNPQIENIKAGNGHYLVSVTDTAGNTSTFERDETLIDTGDTAAAAKLSVLLNPSGPDGENGWYKTTPSIEIKPPVQSGASTFTTWYTLYPESETEPSATLFAKTEGVGTTGTEGKEVRQPAIPADGIWKLHVWAENEFGNRTEFEAVMKVDTESPYDLAVGNLPKDKAFAGAYEVWINRDRNLSAQAKDAVSGVHIWSYSLDRGETWTGWRDWSGRRSIKVDRDVVQEESILFRVKDEAGNEKISKAVTVLRDTEAPWLYLALSDGMYTVLDIRVLTKGNKTADLWTDKENVLVEPVGDNLFHVEVPEGTERLLLYAMPDGNETETEMVEIMVIQGGISAGAAGDLHPVIDETEVVNRIALNHELDDTASRVDLILTVERQYHSSAATETKAASYILGGKLPKGSRAESLDIAMIKQLWLENGGGERTSVHSLEGPIHVTMDLEPEFRRYENLVILRIHDDEAGYIRPEKLEGGTRIRFKTDRFSEYILVGSDGMLIPEQRIDAVETITAEVDSAQPDEAGAATPSQAEGSDYGAAGLVRRFPWWILILSASLLAGSCLYYRYGKKKGEPGDEHDGDETDCF